MPATEPRIGYLQFNSFAGRTQVRVEVVGETRTKVRIRAITRTRLAGRRRSLNPGETALVPKHAVWNKPAANAEMCES